jgi:putative transposase
MSAAPLLLSSGDLAALKIDGLPADARAIRRLVPGAGWQTQLGPRGTILIDVNSLSPAQAEIVRGRLAARIPAPTTQGSPQADKRQGAGRPAGTNFFARHPEIANCVLSILSTHDFAAPRVLEMISAHGFSIMPPIHTLRRYIKKLNYEKQVALALFRDPDKAKSKYKLALGRMDGGETFAHETWELDTTKFDLFFGDGRRNAVLGVIDRWSRRSRFLVAPSESSQSVLKLLLETILAWGVIPNRIVVDNGSGYINKSVSSACKILNVEIVVCQPGSPELKPFVERLFGRVTRERAVVLHGFSGSNVAEAQRLRAQARKETRKAKVVGSHTVESLQAVLNNWTVGVYESRIHGGIGMAPLAKAMRSPLPARPAPPETDLKRVLTSFVGNLVVGKKGLRWKSGQGAGQYMSAELVPYIGMRVHVRRDAENLGVLLAFEEDGEFIGEAVDWMRSGLSERAFAIAQKHEQRKHDKVVTTYIREQRRKFPMEKALQGILRADAEAAGKLVTLPTQNGPAEAVVSRGQAPAKIYKMPSAATTRGNVAALVERAESLLARNAEGHTLDANDLAWANAFIRGPGYAAFKAEATLEVGGKPVIITHRRKT